MTLTDP